MKPLAILFVLFASLGADWPQKGDTVFVSADLRMVRTVELRVPACSPMRVTARYDSGKVNVRDDAGVRWDLAANMLPRLHSDAATCAQTLKTAPGHAVAGPLRVAFEAH